MIGVGRGGGGHYNRQHVSPANDLAIITYPATRLIELKRGPRGILLFKMDDMVLEEPKPIE